MSNRLLLIYLGRQMYLVSRTSLLNLFRRNTSFPDVYSYVCLSLEVRGKKTQRFKYSIFKKKMLYLRNIYYFIELLEKYPKFVLKESSLGTQNYHKVHPSSLASTRKIRKFKMGKCGRSSGFPFYLYESV